MRPGWRSFSRQNTWDPIQFNNYYGRQPGQRGFDISQEAMERSLDDRYILNTLELETGSLEEIEDKILAQNNLILYAAWKWGRNK